MRAPSLAIAVAIAVSGCAHERIISKTSSYYKDLGALSQQEVIDNLDATISNPYRIPSRTTFGRGNLTSTDNGNASLAMPLHATSNNSGVATANVGSISDSFQIALVPEVDGTALRALREVYRAAVYPDIFPRSAIALASIIKNKGRWIYWRNIDESIDLDNNPPVGASLWGKGKITRYGLQIKRYLDSLSFSHTAQLHQANGLCPLRVSLSSSSRHPGERRPDGCSQASYRPKRYSEGTPQR